MTVEPGKCEWTTSYNTVTSPLAAQSIMSMGGDRYVVRWCAKMHFARMELNVEAVLPCSQSSERNKDLGDLAMLSVRFNVERSYVYT